MIRIKWDKSLCLLIQFDLWHIHRPSLVSIVTIERSSSWRISKGRGRHIHTNFEFNGFYVFIWYLRVILTVEIWCNLDLGIFPCKIVIICPYNKTLAILVYRDILIDKTLLHGTISVFISEPCNVYKTGWFRHSSWKCVLERFITNQVVESNWRYTEANRLCDTQDSKNFRNDYEFQFELIRFSAKWVSYSAALIDTCLCTRLRFKRYSTFFSINCQKALLICSNRSRHLQITTIWRFLVLQ